MGDDWITASGPITARGAVQPRDCDAMGHFNIVGYQAAFDAANWGYFGLIGMTGRWIADNQRGMAALSQSIRYFAEMVPGENWVVHTRTTEVGDKILRIVSTMYNADTQKIAAYNEMLCVHLDLKTRKSIVLPDDIVANANKILIQNGEPS